MAIDMKAATAPHTVSQRFPVHVNGHMYLRIPSRRLKISFEFMSMTTQYRRTDGS